MGSVATGFGHGRKASCHDMESMSRQGWPFGFRDTALGVATKPGELGGVATEHAQQRA